MARPGLRAMTSDLRNRLLLLLVLPLSVTDTPARRNAAQENAELERARAVVMNDPFVQTMVRDHGAKIVPGSIRPL